MRGTDVACIIGGAIMAVIAGTATASFGLGPAEAALRSLDAAPAAYAAPAAAPIEIALKQAPPSGYAPPASPSVKSIEVQQITADDEQEQPEAYVRADEAPTLAPGIETAAAGTSGAGDDPPPDSDASPAAPAPVPAATVDPVPS